MPYASYVDLVRKLRIVALAGLTALVGLTVLLGLTAGTFAAPQSSFAPNNSSPAQDLIPVKEQCQQVTQDPDALWRTIPWETDLLLAQKLAVENHKPIFVWAMDGHPLGCT